MDPAYARRQQIIGQVRTIDIIKNKFIDIRKADHLPECSHSSNGICTCGKFEAEEILDEWKV